jgi:uncharacterized protein (DUF433 family)
MDWHGIIVCDPAILVGKPTVKGTRISVELILERLAAGDSVAEVISEYPQLTAEAIRAALAFAKDSLAVDFVYPLAPAPA